MDFSLSEDQQSLRSLARKILEDHSTHEHLKEVEAEPDRFDRESWQALAKANLLGLAVPESFGGSGFGLEELAILLEEVGRTTAAVPAWASLVLGALPLVEFGSEAQQERWLPGVATGQRVLSAALVEPGNEEAAAPRAIARRDGGGFRLSGRKGLAPALHLAERVLVSARAGDAEVGLFWIDPQAPGVTVARETLTTGEPWFWLDLEGAEVAPEEVLVAPQAGAAAARWLEERGAVGLCALQIGVVERALERTAEYVSERRQFDRPVGSFQAVHQRAADAYIDVEAIRLTTWQALHRLSRGEEAGDAVAIAKYWAAEGGARASYAAQHLHGGIGIDLDYPLHRHYLWARQIGLVLGSGTRQLERIGAGIAAGAGAV